MRYPAPLELTFHRAVRDFCRCGESGGVEQGMVSHGHGQRNAVAGRWLQGLQAVQILRREVGARSSARARSSRAQALHRAAAFGDYFAAEAGADGRI
jgi:hypothetical protein